MCRAMTTNSRAFTRPVSAALVAVALFTMANALVGCGGSKSTEQTQAPSTGTEQTAQTSTGGSTAPAGGAVELDGAKIYSEKCSLCHGPNGKGDGPGGAALNPKPRDHTDGAYMNARTNEQLLEVIHNGKGAMPAWKGLLTDEQIKAVLGHVRSLAVPPYTGPQP
jgi:mono/diheme cytochrome c family protein